MYVRRHPELWLWMHRRWRHPDVLTGDEVLMRDESEAGDV
jgi:lauroyl/myristoyl acyltransferase